MNGIVADLRAPALGVLGRFLERTRDGGIIAEVPELEIGASCVQTAFYERFERCFCNFCLVATFAP